MWPRFLPFVGVIFGDATNSPEVPGFAIDMSVDSQGIAHVVGQGTTKDQQGNFHDAVIHANNRWETRQTRLAILLENRMPR